MKLNINYCKKEAAYEIFSRFLNIRNTIFSTIHHLVVHVRTSSSRNINLVFFEFLSTPNTETSPKNLCPVLTSRTLISISFFSFSPARQSKIKEFPSDVVRHGSREEMFWHPLLHSSSTKRSYTHSC